MRILEPGLAVVTDLGRFEGPALGFSVNGALDQYSARLANVLVGNPDAAPLVELTASTLRVVLEADALVAVTGAPARLVVDGALQPVRTPVSVRRGAQLELAVVGPGLRSYLAVRGGLDVPMLLGSCAPDTMIGFGTRLAAGTTVPERTTTNSLHAGLFPVPLVRLDIPAPRIPVEPVVDVTDGPDYAEFGASADALFAAPFRVDPRSNHVGLRLVGSPPVREVDGEVLSRGVPVGAVEVPSRDGLLVLHRGRGVTAGYPVLAVLTTTALDLVAQVPPGHLVRFRRVTIADAQREHRSRRARLARLRERCATALAAHGIEPDADPAPAVLGSPPVAVDPDDRAA
jgi:biotin-dependent carboxylase-like uncharacterized protein